MSKLLLKTILLFILIIIIGTLGYTTISSLLPNDQTTIRSQAAVVKQIKSLNRLETTSYSIEKIIEAGSPSANRFNQILFGDQLLLIAHRLQPGYPNRNNLPNPIHIFLILLIKLPKRLHILPTRLNTFQLLQSPPPRNHSLLRIIRRHKPRHMLHNHLRRTPIKLSHNYRHPQLIIILSQPKLPRPRTLPLILHQLLRLIKPLHRRLPPPQILTTKLDNSQTRIYNRNQGLLAPGNKDLESQARQAAEDQIRQAACDDGILEQAATNGRQQLQTLLSPYTAQITIQIPPGQC